MTTTQDIQAALDKIKEVVRILEDIKSIHSGTWAHEKLSEAVELLQSHAPVQDAVDLDALKREAVLWYRGRFDRADIIGMPSDREVLFDYIDHLASRGYLRQVVSEPVENKTHKWDRDGERCVYCGDKDWMGDPVCRGTK